MQRFFSALTFLTRIPVPVPGKPNFDPEDLRGSIYYFPVVGLLIGAILGGSWFFLNKFFPPLITGTLVIFIQVMLAGGLHLDGLMDTLDGLGGGNDREERLAIMKDCHPGAFGVQGAVLLILLKFGVYSRSDAFLLPLLVVTPVIGRQVLVWAQVIFPYARAQGLGKLFSVYGDYRKLAITTGFTLLVLIVLLKWNGAILFVLAGIFSILLAAAFARLLGGLTGDTYGALCEITECFVLLAGFLLEHFLLPWS